MPDIHSFESIWFVDFEFCASAGRRPQPLCLVAEELRSGRVVRRWLEGSLSCNAPYPTDKETLFVSFFASAEISCHLALGWRVPERILDLYVEFRNLTNGRTTPRGRGLLGALSCFGLPGIGDDDKDSLRQLAKRGGPYSEEEREELLDYCQSDVRALRLLFQAMQENIDSPRALLRGRYMAAVARMEHQGVPLDAVTLNALRSRWSELQVRLVAEVDDDYGVYEGQTFKRERFESYLHQREIAWPRLPSGALALDDRTFSSMALLHPKLRPLKELRRVMGQLRLTAIAMRPDDRNRCLLSPYGAKTGRNTPSSTAFIFGGPAWLRHLIQPPPGRALAYIDWSQQEFGIAAALSGDLAMQDAYLSGDPYLAFGKQAGGIPDHGTKQSHAAQREQFKACVLATQYGMGPQSFAQRIGKPLRVARELLDVHRRTYRQFWNWSDSAVAYGLLNRSIHTVFGWRLSTVAGTNSRTLRNFPAQGNGAEMLRLASCLISEAGVELAAPVHDAVLIEAETDNIDDAVRTTQVLMRKASSIVLDGFELRTDVEIIRHPGRFVDERGVAMWSRIQRMLKSDTTQEVRPLASDTPVAR